MNSKYFGVAILVIVLFSGCGQSVPECDSSDVKDKVIDKLKSNIQNNFIMKKTGILFSGYTELKNSLDNGEYNDKESEIISTVLDQSDEYLDSINIEIRDIKTISTHKKYFKSECSAKYITNGRKRNLKYIAQDTENDGLVIDFFR